MLALLAGLEGCRLQASEDYSTVLSNLVLDRLAAPAEPGAQRSTVPSRLSAIEICRRIRIP